MFFVNAAFVRSSSCRFTSHRSNPCQLQYVDLPNSRRVQHHPKPVILQPRPPPRPAILPQYHPHHLSVPKKIGILPPHPPSSKPPADLSISPPNLETTDSHPTSEPPTLSPLSPFFSCSCAQESSAGMTLCSTCQVDLYVIMAGLPCFSTVEMRAGM